MNYPKQLDIYLSPDDFRKVEILAEFHHTKPSAILRNAINSAVSAHLGVLGMQASLKYDGSALFTLDDSAMPTEMPPPVTRTRRGGRRPRSKKPPARRGGGSRALAKAIIEIPVELMTPAQALAKLRKSVALRKGQ